MSNVSTKQFLDLKAVAQKALEEGKGLWKEQKANSTKTETINTKEYFGIVTDVHSGDSISVYN